jgi:hypothetical protein
MHIKRNPLKRPQLPKLHPPQRMHHTLLKRVHLVLRDVKALLEVPDLDKYRLAT